MPHSFMKIGEVAMRITDDSQKIENPRNITLNGTRSQSLVVNSKPWVGCPHQTIFSPLRRRPWNASVCTGCLLHEGCLDILPPPEQVSVDEQSEPCGDE